MPKVKVRYAAAPKPPAPVLIEGRGYRYSQADATITFYVECFKPTSKKPQCGCAFTIELPKEHDASKVSKEKFEESVKGIETLSGEKNPLFKVAPEIFTIFKFTSFKAITRERYDSEYADGAPAPEDDGDEEIAVKSMKDKRGKTVLGLASEGGAQ